MTQYLIAQALPNALSTPVKVLNTSSIEDRLVKMHFLSHIPRNQIPKEEYLEEHARHAIVLNRICAGVI